MRGGHDKSMNWSVPPGARFFGRPSVNNPDLRVRTFRHSGRSNPPPLFSGVLISRLRVCFPMDTIKKLMLSPTLFDPIRTPRYPIVLCHGRYSTFHTWWRFVHIGKLLGLYGFDVRGPASFPRLQQHYWHNILSILRGKVGAEVIVTSVPS